MAIQLISSTESQEALDRAVSDDWRTPPPSKSEEPAPTAGEAPLDKLPPMDFAKAREQQIRDRKESEWQFRRSEENGGKPYRKSGIDKRIDNLTKARRQAETRAEAAERRIAELEARFNSASPAPAQTQTPASPADTTRESASSSAAQPAEHPAPRQPHPQSQREQGKAEALTPHQQQMARGRSKYADFDAAMAEADRSGFELPTEESIEVLKNLPNSSDVMYRLAKDHQLREQISANPEKSVEILRQVSVQEQQQAQSAQQPRVNQEVIALKRRWDSTSTPQERAELIGAFNQNYTGARVIDSVAREISNLSNPVQVSLVVAKNPQLATTLSKMSQTQVAMVLGSISRDLEARAAATSQEKPEKSKIRPPAPIEPLGQSATRSGMSLEEMPIRDFIKERNRQERSRRR